MSRVAMNHLKSVDPILGRVIDQVGPCRLRAENWELYHYLIRSVIYQQLAGAAARTIYQRFCGLFGGEQLPDAETLGRRRLTTLKKAGLSQQKATYILAIAQAQKQGQLPTLAEAKKLSDHELITLMTQIKGVGEWTAQMVLMFNLGRRDILPTKDYGVCKAFSLLYQTEMPKPKELMVLGEKWAPYRSVAAWYLWRYLDTDWD